MAGTTWCASRGTSQWRGRHWPKGLLERDRKGRKRRLWKKTGVIERRRIWTDSELGDYVREELGFPGAKQEAMVEKEMVDIATGEVERERWYLLTSLSSRQCGPPELLHLFRSHWSIENSHHHVKDRSWGEDVHTLRRPGLGEVFATLVNTGLNALRLEGWFPSRMSMPSRAKTYAFRSIQTINRLYGWHS